MNNRHRRGCGESSNQHHGPITASDGSKDISRKDASAPATRARESATTAPLTAAAKVLKTTPKEAVPHQIKGLQGDLDAEPS
jgi:hypothetical protein